MSLGVGDDMVIRMNIDSVDDLLTNMIEVLQSCRLPKVKPFLYTIGQILRLRFFFISFICIYKQIHHFQIKLRLYMIKLVDT